MVQTDGPEAITSRFESAWNAHDMQAFAAPFHPDATFVNRFATYWRGADAIVAGHRRVHETIFSDSILETEAPDVDSLSPDAAVLHFWTRLTTGAAHPAGPHQVDTLILAVLTRRDGEWRIQAAENVTLTDPVSNRAILRER